MNPALYVFLNKELGMSVGKAAAQAGHAVHLAVDDYWAGAIGRAANDPYDALYEEWNKTGYTKLVMEARDAVHIYTLERYFEKHGYTTYMVIDEGRTEIAPHQVTAMAVEVVDRDDPRAWVFKDHKLYRDKESKKLGTEPVGGLISRHRKRN